ncbi:hypothetical protein [Sphingobium abikonense]|uniref:hypothetical protein n=1 Tax=Sphingobium abikonense TaxID=86193 RepID=UPI003519A811
MSNESYQGAEDQQKAASVYDFVYVDIGRIAATLSQFDDNGHLIKLTSGDVSRSARSGELAVPAIAKGKVDQSADSSIGREYDPAWLAPLNFLDELNCRNLIQRDIEASRIGQFVLVSGSLSVTDLQLLAGVWKDPTIRKQMSANMSEGETTQNRAARRSSHQKRRQEVNEAEIALSLINQMPHYVQATVGTGLNSAWCNLEPQHMRIPLGDFALKHGAHIPGEWHAIGILDARPESDDDDYDIPYQNGLGSAYMQLAFPLRFMMGRPIGTYGITPVLLFRQLAAID